MPDYLRQARHSPTSIASEGRLNIADYQEKQKTKKAEPLLTLPLKLANKDHQLLW
jgi:hypothetical protein